MSSQADKNNEVATNFFDDATSEDEDSAYSEPSKAKNLNLNENGGGGIPLESPVRPEHGTPGRVAPPRPPRPSARNSRVVPEDEDTLSEGFRAINEQNSIADVARGPSMPNGFGSNRLSKISMRSKSNAPEMTREQKLLDGHVIAIQTLLLSGGVNSHQVGSAMRSLNIPPPEMRFDRLESFTDTPPQSAKHKAIHRQSHISIAPAPNEAILALTLRTRKNQRSWKVSELKIPASARPINVPNASQPEETKPTQSEKHFQTLDFDDAHFFRRLKDCYHHLAGPFRFFSARGLHHIEVSHSDDCIACESGDKFHSSAVPRSPMRCVSLGLSDSFSEANLMAYYRCSRRGKSSYMFVHWAHRLASTPAHLQPPAPLPAPPVPPSIETSPSRRGSSITPPIQPPPETSARRGSAFAPQLRSPMDERRIAAGECIAGLEFVQGWVAWKIALAVAAALVMSVLAMVLWITVGVSGGANIGRAGERAGRVVAGCLLGGFILGLEVVLVVVWMGISWLMD